MACVVNPNLFITSFNNTQTLKFETELAITVRPLLKGNCQGHRFKNSRFQKHILQQLQPTNTHVCVLFNTHFLSCLLASLHLFKSTQNMENIDKRESL